MKMQLREILKLPAVDDKPIGGELIFMNKTLHSGIQVSEEGSVRGIEIHQGGDRLLRHDQHVEGISRLRMMKCHQRFGFTQSFDGDGKTHVGKHPSNDNLYQP